jgi:ADP-ribose pyrophosphatase YjhB (NUDIX family)
MSQSFSPIQNGIISKLKNAERLRYSELQPDTIPNDLFNYHLQFLVKKGFVDRTEEGYSLAESGIRHVADPDISNLQQKIASLFKVNVITIVSRIKDGKVEILNQLRKSHPSFGKIGVMGGIVLKGEPLEEAATRKLREECGLDASFKIIGIERRFLHKDEELFSDVLFPIAYCDAVSGALQSETEFGENFWVDIDEAIENDSAEFDSIQAIVKVLNAIKVGSIDTLPFFYQECTQKRPS